MKSFKNLSMKCFSFSLMGLVLSAQGALALDFDGNDPKTGKECRVSIERFKAKPHEELPRQSDGTIQIERVMELKASFAENPETLFHVTSEKDDDSFTERASATLVSQTGEEKLMVYFDETSLLADDETYARYSDRLITKAEYTLSRNGQTERSFLCYIRYNLGPAGEN